MVDRRTSQTDPLRVSWLPGPGPGRVGLTFAPGKKTGHWDRDLATDLDSLVALQVRHLVCLVEDAELLAMQIPHLVPEATRRGVAVERLPIVDYYVPDSFAEVRALCFRIEGRVRGGEAVVIHCAGGLGRTGTIAGCYLASRGIPLSELFERLHAARGPSCPETDDQRAFVADFAARLAGPASFEDRAVAVVLGAAIGDAMGHPTEFVDSFEAIRRRWPPDGVRGYELYWTRGAKRFAPYTDDTQMAEVVLRALVEGREERAGFEAIMRSMADGFARWSDEPQGGHRAPGGACMRGSRALGRGVPWREAGGPDDGGCGSVMRSYPFGLAFPDDPDEAVRWSVAHSAMTHRATIALAACAAMARGVALAVTGERSAAIVASMVEAAGAEDRGTAEMIERAVLEAGDGTPPEVTLQRLRGWAAHEAIAAAVYVFARHPDDFAAAVLEAANTPGDSDSIATLAGALVAARTGLGGIPAGWIADVERSEELTRLAVRIA